MLLTIFGFYLLHMVFMVVVVSKLFVFCKGCDDISFISCTVLCTIQFGMHYVLFLLIRNWQ